MTTIDQLLINLVTNHLDNIKKWMPARDSKVLLSLNKIITGPSYITENQGRLILKILSQHQEQLQSVIEDLPTFINLPSWSKPFRPLDKTKKLYSTNFPDGTPMLTIEFAFSATLRKLIQTLSKAVSGLSNQANGKLYFADFTEQNIITLIDTLSKHEFDIEEKLKNHYETIKSWSGAEVIDQFRIANISHPNFQVAITADLGIETAIDKNIIADRSMRYQYFHEKTVNLPATLTEQIANRTSTRVWIPKQTTALKDIFQSLLKLKRFPVLVVFDNFDPNKSLEDLKQLSDCLDEYRIFENIGIYFRLDNTDTGKQFNQLIAERQYNAQLTEATTIVGVQSGKIPKFLLKSDWKPMSVISIGNHLRHSKTAVYSNCCDLVISYTDNEPIVETRNIWE